MLDLVKNGNFFEQWNLVNESDINDFSFKCKSEICTKEPSNQEDLCSKGEREEEDGLLLGL